MRRIRRMAALGLALSALPAVAWASWLVPGTGNGVVYGKATHISDPALAAIQTDAGQVTLSWTTPAPTPSSYSLSGPLGDNTGGCLASGMVVGTPGASASCTVNGLGKGTYSWTLQANLGATWIKSSAASNVSVAYGKATQLAFAIQPSVNQNIQARGTGSFSVSAVVEDAGGNTVSNDARTIALSLGANPSSGTLSCGTGLSVSASAGVAAFTGCAIDKAGTGYALAATSSPTLTVPTNAHNFNITAGAPSQVSMSPNPGSAAQSATTNLQLTLQLKDQNGNNATAGAGGVTLALSSSPHGGFSATSGGTESTPANVAFTSGVGVNTTWFGDNTVETATVTATNGTAWGTDSVEVGPRLVITSSPVSGSSSSTPNLGAITVQRQDSAGNPLTSGATVVTLTSSPSTGATFGALQFPGATITTVTITTTKSTATFYFGYPTSGSTPTITVSAAGFNAGSQTETITTAPTGLGLASVVLPAGASLSCGTVSTNYTCTVSSAGKNGTVTFAAAFLDSTGTAVVYSATQSSTVSETGGPTATIAANGTTSTGTLTASANGNASKTSTLTFGPYTLAVTVNP